MKKNSMEVVQINIEAIVMTTNAEGKAVEFNQHKATVAQANFKVTLNDIAKSVLEGITNKKDKEPEKIIDNSKVAPK